MKELNLDGIFVSPFVGDLVLAMLLYLLVHRLLRSFDIERRVWHPQLFNLCVFLILLSALSLLPL